LRLLLDQELSHLPDVYRAPIVCCDLEGKTRQEAARQLGWSEGTLSGRLSRARALLAKRLNRRGILLSAGSLAAALAQEAAAAGMPYSLMISTVRAGSVFAVGQATGAISLKVAALTEGVLKAMWVTKLKITTAVLATVCVVGIGSGGVAYRLQAAARADGTSAAASSQQVAAADDEKPGDAAPQPEERQRLEKLLQELQRQIRKVEVSQEQAQLEKLRKQLEEQLRAAQAQQKDIAAQREQALKAIKELNDHLSPAAKARREIEKVLEGVRKAGDKKTEIKILEEIENAVKEMKRKAQAEQGNPQ
jgi:hypothetical protein